MGMQTRLPPLVRGSLCTDNSATGQRPFGGGQFEGCTIVIACSAAFLDVRAASHADISLLLIGKDRWISRVDFGDSVESIHKCILSTEQSISKRRDLKKKYES